MSRKSSLRLAAKLLVPPLQVGLEHGRLPAMEGLRAYAVLLTFIVHFFGAWLVQFRRIDTATVTPTQVETLTDRIMVWLQLSPYGVYLFFVISGFLICRITQQASFRYGRFLWRRASRIYPAFLVALLFGVATFSLHAGWAPLTLRNIAGNLVFLNGVRELRIDPYLQQSWSLFFEGVFYIVAPILVLARRPSMWWAAGLVLALGAILVYTPFTLGWGQALFILFFAGAAAGRLNDAVLERFARIVPDWIVLSLCLVVNNLITFKVFSDHVTIVLFATTGTLLLVQACYGAGALNRIFSWPPLRRLGNVSYSFFLLHTIPIYFAVVVLAPRILTGTGLASAFVIGGAAFVVSLVLATASFQVSELPYFAHKAPRVPVTQ